MKSGKSCARYFLPGNHFWIAAAQTSVCDSRFCLRVRSKENRLVFRDSSCGLVDRLLSAAKSRPRIHTNSHERNFCEVSLGHPLCGWLSAEENQIVGSMKEVGWGLIGCGYIAQKRIEPAIDDSTSS